MKPLSHQRSARVSPTETLTPSSQKQRSPRVNKENLDPAAAAAAQPETSPFRPSSSPMSKSLTPRNRSLLPPRPPSNPLKRKLCLDTLPENGSPASDSGVQVIVRMRPPRNHEEEGERIVRKISPNSLLVMDHTFTFDSVADAASTQQDIYQLVGLPLVENCLAGFNSSIFAYGQTGGGKTYTMWGPPSALLEDDSLSKERGLTPRVFALLFSRIREDQARQTDRQLNYQCRCSFLEIYNEQVTDLLDPTQHNLQIREDVKTGVYVDYLTEEYVFTMKDVTQLLIKGLSNRRTGATSINAESSRSHCVFTCVVESRSKSISDGLISLRTSRINLVDLAGSERQKLTGAAGDRLKEAGNINRSLSQLGNLINILAEVSQSGKQRHIPYRDSKLTFLLQESLGGNAKLAMICAISPSQSCKSETFSTLRFAQRAKAIKNNAVVNEETQDDVNVLREQIRQLKDELVRMKSDGTPTVNNGNYSTGWNARRSLNILKMSLNRPTVLPVVKDDSDEEMEIDEGDVETPEIKACMKLSSSEQLHINSKELRSFHSGCELKTQLTHRSVSGSGNEQVHVVINDISEVCESKKITLDKVNPESEKVATICGDSSTVQITDRKDLLLQKNNLLSENSPMEEDSVAFKDLSAGKVQNTADTSGPDSSHNSSSSPNSIMSSCNLSIVPCETSPLLQSPTLSISPIAKSFSRKSIRTSSSTSASQNNLENVKSDPDVLNLSFRGPFHSKHKLVSTSLAQTRQSPNTSTEHLAASLHRGLQVIENHHHSSALRSSSFRFSMRPIDMKSLVAANKVDVGVQTLHEESELLADFSTFVCSYCKNRVSQIEFKDAGDEANLQLVPIDGQDVPGTSDKLKTLVPKAVEKVLAGAIRREMALEDLSMKQAAEIVQLNRLVRQYKHERECNAMIEQTREDKISRLEGLMDGILTADEFMEEEFTSLLNEHKLVKEKYENHPEVLRINIELKKIQSELDEYRNFFDMGERDVLVEEIQDLMSQLQYYMDSPSTSTQKLSKLLRLTHSCQPTSSPLGTVPEVNEENVDEKLQHERCSWTETESTWISLCEELKLELEASRSLAEKWERELSSEKRCAEELKEALQTAMEGHARILEQYAELQEKHVMLLGRHRKISDGIEDVKRAALKAGVKGAESRFINSLAAEISALRVEREKERQYWRDENKGLQIQLRDTAEAVQAAGELLVRLKEAEEAAAVAEKRTALAELETEKAYQEMENLKKNYDAQVVSIDRLAANSQLTEEDTRPDFKTADFANRDGGDDHADQRRREEFEPFCQEPNSEFSRGTEPYAWYSGYDRCNI